MVTSGRTFLVAASALAGAPVAALAVRRCRVPGRLWPAVALGLVPLLFAWAGAAQGGEAALTLAGTLALGWALAVLAMVDAATYRLPNALTLPLTALGLLASLPLGREVALNRLVGSVLGYGVLAGLAWAYWRLRGREGLGLGDAKLLAAAGAWLGWRALPQTVLLGCFGAFAWIAVRATVRGRAALQEPLPFGAPLCLAIWLARLYGGVGG